MRRFLFAFGANNNVRAMVFLIIAFAWLAFNLAVVGIAEPQASIHHPAAQRYYNLIQRGEFKTDAELASAASGFSDWVGGAVSWASWRLNLIFLAVSLVYAPIALREEMAAAHRAAMNAVRNRRAVAAAAVAPVAPPPAGAPAGAVPAAPAAAGAAAGGRIFGRWETSPEWLTYIGIFLRELFAGTLAEALFGRR